MFTKKHTLAMSACVLAMTGLMGSGPAAANDELIKLSKDPAQWVIPAGNYGSQRYTSLTQINTKTAKNLRPVWTFSTGVLRGHEGGPLVIGDTMYLSAPYPNTVFALDLNENGRILWKYEPRQDPNVIPVMCCDTVNRGVAYGEGKIFLQDR
jgi:glucose dehydrogenase